MMRKVILTSTLIVVWLALAVGSVAGATFVVNSAGDIDDPAPGDGLAGTPITPDSSSICFRAAIQEANALLGPDTILVPSSVSPIRLTKGACRVTDHNTTILGTGGWPVVDGVTNPFGRPTLILESDSNTIRGLTFKRSRGDCLIISGAHNQIGDTLPAGGNVFIGGGLDLSGAIAIALEGPAARLNVIYGNHIGVMADGLEINGNRHGVKVSRGASNNMIGGLSPGSGNIISGNDGYGVIITGNAVNNQVARNFIGLDGSGEAGPGNDSGGVLVDSESQHNVIGGLTLDEGNLIAANGGHGVELRGQETHSNTINGNLIGVDASGQEALGNLGDGILICEGAHDNEIGGAEAESGNQVSANGGHGIRLSGEGTSGNYVRANWVGITLSGYSAIGNGWVAGNGLTIEDGAAVNWIGGTTESERNVISGNHGFGIEINGVATASNRVWGNFIGVNANGTSSVFNTAGVVICNGAHNNIIGGDTDIEGNIISGNRAERFPYGAGVLICNPGTNSNRVSANVIGLDVTGFRALRNGSAGVIIGDGAQRNIIGGANLINGNIICGNGAGPPSLGVAAGIHLYGVMTQHNIIIGNHIGLPPRSQVPIGNAGHGIGLFAGASHNQIGGPSIFFSNHIGGNEMHGIFMSGPETLSNHLQQNNIFDNDSLGIALADSAQNGILPPVVTTVGVLVFPGPRLIAGRDAPPRGRIDVFQVGDPDGSGSGEGDLFLGSGVANSIGTFNFYLPIGGAYPITVTATVTDSDSNTSAFAINASSADVTGLDDELSGELLPISFGLEQNYPNPFNPNTIIEFSIPAASLVQLDIYNELGQRVMRLLYQKLSAGQHRIEWDGRTPDGDRVASGVYFYRLAAGEQTITRKMLLIK